MKKWKWLAIVAVVFVFLVLVIPILSRGFLTQYALKKASEAIGAPVQIASAELDLLHGGVAIRHLKIFNPLRPKEAFVSMDVLGVRLPLLPLLQGKKGVLSVTLDEPEILYKTDASGTWELKDKLPILAKKGQSQKSLPFDIEKISIDNGLVKYEDRKAGKTTTLSHIDFVVHHLAPATSKDPLPASFTLKFKIDDQAPFRVEGKGDFLSAKISFQAQAHLSDLPIPPYSPYYESSDIPVIIRKGFLEMTSPVQCHQDTLRAPVHVRISQLDIQPKSKILYGLDANVVVDQLKNKNGNLELDLLVAGDIHNPQFHLTTNLAQAFVKGLAAGLIKSVPKIIENVPKMIEKAPTLKEGVETGIKKLKGIFGQ